MLIQVPLRIGPEAIAIITGSFISGSMMNISMLVVPVLLDTATQPFQLVNQWVRVYHYGHRVLPGMAITTFLLYSYTAFTKYASGSPWRVYAVAGAMTLSLVPFTWIFMLPTNNTLFRAHKQGLAEGKELDPVAARKLVSRWAWLHVARSLLPLGGAVIGMLAAFRVLEF